MFTYDQKSGALTHGTLEIGVGYSGNGIWKNNPAGEAVANHGPIPKGLYTIGVAGEDVKLGPVVMALTPDPDNEMFGRSAFFLHGDSIENPGEGSDGCIVQGLHTRQTVSLSHDKQLQVI